LVGIMSHMFITNDDVSKLKATLIKKESKVEVL